MKPRFLFAVVVLLGTAADTRRAHGEPTKTEVAVARMHFEQAQVAEQEGRWKDAVDELSRAVSIKETAGLRYHLGYAKENLGLLVDALLEYQRAQGLVRSGVTNEEVERFLTPKLKELRARVPTVTVLIRPEPMDSAELQIDGTAVNRLLFGSAMPVNPGTHELVVVVPGYRPFRAQITVAEGSSVKQVAELVPEPILAAQSGDTRADNPARTGQPSSDRLHKPEDSRGPVRTWVLVGEGAIFTAGLALGLGYGLSARSTEDKMAQLSGSIAAIDTRPNACSDFSGQSMLGSFCAQLSEAAADRDRARDRAIAGIVTAGVSGTALALTWLLWKPGSPAGARTAVTLGSNGVTLSGRY